MRRDLDLRAAESSGDPDLMAPVPLSVVCLRYAPAGMEEPALDRINRRIPDALQREGRVYPTHSKVRSRFAIRACVLNPGTSEAEMDLPVSEILRLERIPG